MPCNHPLVGLQYSKVLLNKQGEKYNAIKILNSEEISRYENFDNFEEWPSYAKWIWEGKKRYKIKKVIQIPCGKCEGCRLDQAREMSIRCALESLEWKENHFITLTYDDKHIPKTRDHIRARTNEITGEVHEIDNEEENTLWYPDFQKFMKDLREYWRTHYNHTDIRFYMCGEYGPKTNRAHIHAIIYNLPIEPEDLIPYTRNKYGQMRYTCPVIENIWKKGFVTVADVSWETCCYVAQYCTKKKGGTLYGEIKEDFYKRQGKMPEFTQCSRRPGIGKAYFEKNFWDIYKDDQIMLKAKTGLKKVRPSSYYDKLFEDEGYEEYLKELKEKRQEVAKENMKCILSRTTLTEKEYLLQREKALHDKRKKFKRDGCETVV